MFSCAPVLTETDMGTPPCKISIDLYKGAYTKIRNRDPAPTLQKSNYWKLLRMHNMVIASMVNEIQLDDATYSIDSDSALFLFFNISTFCIMYWMNNGNQSRFWVHQHASIGCLKTSKRSGLCAPPKAVPITQSFDTITAHLLRRIWTTIPRLLHQYIKDFAPVHQRFYTNPPSMNTSTHLFWTFSSKTKDIHAVTAGPPRDL